MINPDTVGGVYHTAEGKTVIVYGITLHKNYGYYVLEHMIQLMILKLGVLQPPGTTDTIYIKTVYDPSTERIVIVYSDSDNSGHGTAVVGSLSGTTMTMGTPVVFNADTEEISVCMDTTNNKVVISFNDHGNSQYTTVIVGTIGGSNNRSISFGDKDIDSGNTGTTYLLCLTLIQNRVSCCV